MERRVSLKEIIRNAGLVDLERQPCLPAPLQPAILASEEDHAQARNILLDRRHKHPENKGVLKNIFRSSKDKDKSHELEFTQDELDQALSAVIRVPSSGPGLVQAFLAMGAKVNVIETTEKKKKIGGQSNVGLRRRSTVLQQAATLRRADSVHILASSGADQTTLDEGLKAALAANDQPCIQELLRHGADISKFPNALANAVRSNDQNFVRLLLRAPKPLRPEIISSCLPAAVQQQSYVIVSLLVTYGADPNFDSSSALNNAIGLQDYQCAVAMVAGPIPLSYHTLQRLLDTAMRLPTRQATLRFLQLLFACGLPPDSIGLPDLLICTVRHNDTTGARMMLSYGVSTTTNEAECLREAITNENWILVDAILETPISAKQASLALPVLSPRATQPHRNRVISQLIERGATGVSLSRWINRASQEQDLSLLKSLIEAGGTVDPTDMSALQSAVTNNDIQSLRLLLTMGPNSALLSRLFPFLRNFTSEQKREFTYLLLEYGARGPEVDQALVDAIEDSTSSRDDVLITDLIHRGADLAYDDGKALKIAVIQADLYLVREICNSNPPKSAISAALPLAFDSRGLRHTKTYEIIELMSVHQMEESAARTTLKLAIEGGPVNMDIITRLLTINSNLLAPAFEYAAALENPQKKAPILEDLLKMGIGQEALDQALAAETHHALTTKDTTSAKLLLGRGASVSYNDGEALIAAVASGSSSLTNLLLSGNHQPSRFSVTKAFRTLFADESLCVQDESCLQIARTLLSLGVDEIAKDSALRAIMACQSEDDNAASMVDLLIEYGAHVNTADGACFVFASQKHDSATFEKLLQYGPKFNIIVPALLKSKLPEEAVLASLKMCFMHGASPSELDRAGQDTAPLLTLAMTEYPRGDAVVKLLVDHGMDPDVSIKTIIDASIGPELVSALQWALVQPQKRMSDAVITTLLEAGASVHRTTPTSDMTALMLAAREGRHELVATLLERGSDADSRDMWNHSALFYASHLGSSGYYAVQVLAPVCLRDDGSLHEAVRNLQKDTAAVLIQHGHDPNFPSRLHGGRNVLGELCVQVQINTSKERTLLRQLLRLLLDNNADPSFKVHSEKTCVFLALDNPYSAVPVTEALLETEIWQDLNKDSQIYNDRATNLCYSALSYIERIPCPSRNPAVKTTLLSLLRDAGCAPRYYSTTPLQPVGATGIPHSLVKLSDQQKAHELALTHEKQLYEEKRSMSETLHRDMLRRAREAQDAQLALDRQKHDFETSRLRDAETTKRAERKAWHALVMEQEREATGYKLGTEEHRANLERAGVEARKAELEHRAALEGRLLKEKEDLYERNVMRQKEVMRSADDSAKLHAKLRHDRPAIESNGLAWGNVD